MAINLLKTMKSCCIYKQNGCRWKGLVRDLAAHHRECRFAVTQCPYGCGQAVDRTTMHAHQRVCTWRPVNDCVCGVPFPLKDRAAHEAGCLPFLKQRVPQLLSERDAAHDLVARLSAQLLEVRATAGETHVRAASATAATLLLALALLAIVGQLVRPDAALAVALALLLAVSGRHTGRLRALGVLLPLCSLLADALWLLMLGPRLSALTALDEDDGRAAGIGGALLRWYVELGAADGEAADDADGGGGVRAQLALANCAQTSHRQ